PLFEEVDGPGKMDGAIDPGKVLRVPVGTFETHEGLSGDEAVETGEFRVSRAAAQDDLEPPFHAPREFRQQLQRLAAAQRAEPADDPRLALIRRGRMRIDGRGLSGQFQDLVVKE